jgi:hypothetical protein
VSSGKIRGNETTIRHPGRLWMHTRARRLFTGARVGTWSLRRHPATSASVPL